MNISEIRRNVLSFLRKEPKLTCDRCKDILIWDKPTKRIYNVSLEKNYIGKLCYNCYSQQIGYPDKFTILIIILFTIYFYCIVASVYRDYFK